jgi:hypothetical protein
VWNSIEEERLSNAAREFAPDRVGGPLHEVKVAGGAVVVARPDGVGEQPVEWVEPLPVRIDREVGGAVIQHLADRIVSDGRQAVGAERLQGGQAPITART